jgi:hypothetical protein
LYQPLFPPQAKQLKGGIRPESGDEFELRVKFSSLWQGLFNTPPNLWFALFVFLPYSGKSIGRNFTLLRGRP